jgi:hypothetical protein
MKHILLSAVASGVLIAACTPEGSEDEVGRIEMSQESADAALVALGLSSSGLNHITFENALYDDGVYTFTNVVISDPEDDDDETDADLPEGKTVGGDDVDMDDLDEVRVERMIIDSPHLAANGDVLMRGFALEAISLHDEDDSEDGTATIARFSVDQPNAALSNDIARILIGDFDEDDDTEWNAYRFAAIAMDGFAASGTDEDGEFQVNLDRFALEGYDDESLGRAELLGFGVTGQVDGAPLNISLGEFSVDGLRTEAYSSMMDAIASGASEEEISAAYYDSAFDDPMDMFDEFAMRDFVVEVLGVNVTLDHMTASMVEEGDTIRSRSEIGSFQIWPDASQEGGAQLAMGLNMLGYERIELRMASESVYEHDAGRVYTVGDNFLEITDGLRVEVSQDFAGYDAYFQAARAMSAQLSNTEDPDASLEAVKAMVAPLVLNQMSIRIEDLSLLDRALTAGAAAQGMQADQLRAQAGLMIGMGLMAAPPEIPRTLLAELSTAITGFVNEGGTLIIDLSPEDPVTLGDIMDQAENGTVDFDALGLTINSQAPTE